MNDIPIDVVEHFLQDFQQAGELDEAEGRIHRLRQ